MAQITGHWNNILTNEYLYFDLNELICIALMFRNVLNICYFVYFFKLVVCQGEDMYTVQ